MPTPLEELLASLESDDDGNDGAAGTSQSGGAPENATIKAIREAQQKAVKDAKDLAKALKEARDELETFKTKERTSALDAAFSQFGLPEGVAALARKAYDGEPTPEAVKQFLVDQKVLDAEAASQTGGTTEQKSQGFAPGGTGQGSAPATQKKTRDEWLQIVATDPVRGRELFDQGLVDTTEIDKLA